MSPGPAFRVACYHAGVRARLGVLSVAAAAFAALVLYSSWNYVRGASLVLQAAGASGWIGRAAAIPAGPFTERDLQLPWRGGLLRARLYRPVTRIRRAAVLVPGVHAAGIDSPGLTASLAIGEYVADLLS